MEGKAILFKEFGGIDAWPICLATKDADEIVRTVVAIAPAFGGINLEDIAAPRCFEIEARLREELDIPVFHDDQHGTAIVVLAALLNALRVVGKQLEDVRVVVTGAGAAGAATARMLVAAGAGEVVSCDRGGVLYPGRPGLDRVKAGSPRRRIRAGCEAPPTRRSPAPTLHRPLRARRGQRRRDRSMADGAIVFAMANPTPEIAPRRSTTSPPSSAPDAPTTRTRSTTCSSFPGVFRGALDVRRGDHAGDGARRRPCARDGGRARTRRTDYVIPSVFDRRVAPAVAAAVARAAVASGVERRRDSTTSAS